MGETVKKVRQVCKCENCGNEAEMIGTCTLEEVEDTKAAGHTHAEAEPKKVKGSGTCESCGNESEMWVNL